MLTRHLAKFTLTNVKSVCRELATGGGGVWVRHVEFCGWPWASWEDAWARYHQKLMGRLCDGACTQFVGSASFLMLSQSPLLLSQPLPAPQSCSSLLSAPGGERGKSVSGSIPHLWGAPVLTPALPCGRNQGLRRSALALSCVAVGIWVCG